MKKIIIIILFLLNFMPAIQAKSINNAVYKTMQYQSYRHNYNRQVNNNPMPYWQMQSNFATRNRVYPNYQSYTNYSYKHNNTLNQYRYNLETNRGLDR